MRTVVEQEDESHSENYAEGNKGRLDFTREFPRLVVDGAYRRSLRII